MNLQHLRYAVEVEKAGSISQAADNLFMGQPNLSKAIKELEQSVGVQIFKRTQKGVTTTEKGYDFILNAKLILKNIEDMETRYKPANPNQQHVSIYAPYSVYISNAFAAFVSELDSLTEMEIDFHESGSLHTINKVSEEGRNLGIIRCHRECAASFSKLLSRNRLSSIKLCQFDGIVLMSDKHPLAGKAVITTAELEPYIEIFHGGCAMAEHSRGVLCSADSQICRKKLQIYGQGNHIELITRIPNVYMWSTPLTEDILARHQLVQKTCTDYAYRCEDLLIFSEGYQFRRIEKSFLKKLEEEKQKLPAIAQAVAFS